MLHEQITVKKDFLAKKDLLHYQIAQMLEEKESQRWKLVKVSVDRQGVDFFGIDEEKEDVQEEVEEESEVAKEDDEVKEEIEESESVKGAE